MKYTRAPRAHHFTGVIRTNLCRAGGGMSACLAPRSALGPVFCFCGWPLCWSSLPVFVPFLPSRPWLPAPPQTSLILVLLMFFRQVASMGLRPYAFPCAPPLCSAQAAAVLSFCPSPSSPVWLSTPCLHPQSFPASQGLCKVSSSFSRPSELMSRLKAIPLCYLRRYSGRDTLNCTCPSLPRAAQPAQSCAVRDACGERAC